MYICLFFSNKNLNRFINIHLFADLYIYLNENRECLINNDLVSHALYPVYTCDPLSATTVACDAIDLQRIMGTWDVLPKLDGNLSM